MQGVRILKMVRLDSDVVTVNKPPRAKAYREIQSPISGGLHPKCKPMRSASREVYITKPLYLLTTSEGFAHTMTKKEAKKIFSARQVRKALKRMRATQKQANQVPAT